MDHSKKILILYASAGHGHEKAAKGLKEAFEGLADGVEAEELDTLSLATPFFGNLYRQMYLLQIKYIPWMWGIFYYSFDVPWIYFFIKRVRRILNSVTARNLEKFLIAKDPDVILATHFTGIEVAGFLKEKKKIHSKIVSVVTDYLPHFVWMAGEVDTYAVAIQETKDGLVERGVLPEKVRVTGIPIEGKFSKQCPKEAFIAKWGLEKGKFTVLVTSGGSGIGAMRTLVEGLLDLNKPLQILAVCGTNQRLFAELDARSRKNTELKVFGFVDNMEEFMEASDIVVGKGGGLTITESFSKGKPVILFRSIPGQEKRNALCVERYHAGFAADSAEAIVKKVAELMENPESLRRMKEGVHRMAQANSAKNIATWVKNGLIG